MLFDFLRKTVPVKIVSKEELFMAACRDGCLTQAMDMYEKCATQEERSSLLNFRDINGATPLMHAAGQARTKVVSWLLDTHCVDINAQDSDGTTALMRAAYWGHEDLLHFLIEDCHANVGIRNKRGRSAMHIAKDEKTKMYLTNVGLTERTQHVAAC